METDSQTNTVSLNGLESSESNIPKEHLNKAAEQSDAANSGYVLPDGNRKIHDNLLNKLDLKANVTEDGVINMEGNESCDDNVLDKLEVEAEVFSSTYGQVDLVQKTDSTRDVEDVIGHNDWEDTSRQQKDDMADTCDDEINVNGVCDDRDDGVGDKGRTNGNNKDVITSKTFVDKVDVDNAEDEVGEKNHANIGDDCATLQNDCSQMDVDEQSCHRDIDKAENMDTIESGLVETMNKAENMDTVESGLVETMNKAENLSTAESVMNKAENMSTVESGCVETMNRAESMNITESGCLETVNEAEIFNTAESGCLETVNEAESMNTTESGCLETVNEAERLNTTESGCVETMNGAESMNTTESVCLENLNEAERLNTAESGCLETVNKTESIDKDDTIKIVQTNTHRNRDSSSKSENKADQSSASTKSEDEATEEKDSNSKKKDIVCILPKAVAAVTLDSDQGICTNDKASTSDGQPAAEGQDRPVKYKCLKCSRVMKDKRLIENHSCESEVDEGKVKITISLDKDKKSFMCKECDYTSSGHNFEEHLMCHLMLRPYQCLYCKECFINRKDISRHVLKTHNGAKMSCALRALRKAKALIKEVTSLGVISFMARVAGKVPLEKDPDKKKKTEGVNSGQNNAESEKGMKELEQIGQNITEIETVGQSMIESEQNGKDSLKDSDMKISQEFSGQNVSESEQNCEEFSKLRKALTSKSSKFASSVKTVLENSKIENNSDSDKSNSDSEIKIVASFSLQSVESQDSDREKASSEDAMQLNFITAHPEEKSSEEVLSFLGPERPVFSAGDVSTTSMLPPPPLQPAPFHSTSSTSQILTSRVKQAEKNSHFFVCGFNCLFSSMSMTDFREHTDNFHSSETYFPCYYCGHRSPNEADLVRHISNHTHTHNNSSPLYVCGNAGCKFGTNMVGDYINHIKASHPDVPELACYSCGDTFLEPAMLQAHVEDNVIHIVNCPHCPSKATDRKAILTHISAAHPGKPKMVSVAKQLICHDRKINSFEQMAHLQEMPPPTLTPAPVFATGGSVVDQILSRCDIAGVYSKPSGCSLSDVLTSRSSLSPRDIPSPSSRETSLTPKPKETTPESVKSPTSESSDFDSMKVKEEMSEDADGYGESVTTDDPRAAYVLDENGVRRRVYIPMSERRAENYRCKHCTFIARDFKRMHCHEKSHGMPPTRKERFKCMFCPQGFDSELKFRMHVTCHPGIIKFLLYRCKKCEFDTNQKHTIVRHITCNRDRKHRGFGPLEEQYTVMSRSLESRVLECERCDYMTRHKIHMAIHYQRKHNILKDKGEFTIENQLPTDTPLPSYGLPPREATSSSSMYNSFQSPDSSNDGTFDFTKPSGSVKKSKEKIYFDSPVQTTTQINERNELFNQMVSQQAALQPGHISETQMRKFKCPICKYLLPKAADLKNHVKRHSEISQITLVMFRCKYCSCMSTARELLYEHLAEKHSGKPIALVKKIVAIDTTEVDKSFAETSMEESLDLLEESLHQEIMSNLNQGSSLSADLLSSSYEQLFVIPEGEDNFVDPLQCPRCSFSSSSKSEIIHHVSLLHPEVRVIGSDEDVDNLARATSEGIQQAAKPSTLCQNSQEEVLIIPDDQIFSESALCSRCDFSTVLRREMVHHLQQNHPEISVMGRNSYPVQVTAMGQLNGPVDESCVVGSGSLDAKLRCMYENYGTQMKCLICGAERPKKFFIHMHILRHLNIYLWKCAFCTHRGLQKYKMVDHIKKMHPGKPLSVRYLQVNVEEKVSNFLSMFNVIKDRKASLDEGNYVPYTSLTDELSDQSSNDSTTSRQKSPGPGGGSNCPHSLGTDELDEKISGMYESIDGAYFKCRACPNQFQRKFAMHRHIIISHLKVALLSCAYCGMEGVERHQLVDHILACHKPAPISILTLDIDLHKMASDFMAKMAAKEKSGGSFGRASINDIARNLAFSKSAGKVEEDYNDNLAYCSDNKKFMFNSTKSLKPPTFRFGNKGLNAAANVKTSTVDPDVIMLGRNALDTKLSCLYQQRPSGQLRCLVCRWEFPRKYPLHRHIMLRHLKMSLVGCPYCPFQGIEKYNVATHIREEHKDKPINILFTQPDVEGRVRQFMDDIANNGGQGQDLIRKPKSKSQSLLAMSKVEKQSDDEEDDDNDGDEDSGEIARRPSHGGLVVAMFGKKKVNDDILVKTEIEDNDFEEGAALHTNDDEDDDDNEEGNNDYNEDEDPGADKSSYEPSFATKSSLKYPPLNSYVPGSYRSPAGGKAKALDVTTKIKVLKAKDGPIMKFYCEKCNFTSLHRSNIVRHIYKIHEKYQTHTCPMCNYQTLSLMLMQKHMDKAHPIRDHIDDSFTQNIPEDKPLLSPVSFPKKKENFPGKISEVKTSTTTTTSSSNQAPKHYACAYCYYETDAQEDILQHTRDNHSRGESQSSGVKSPGTSEPTISKTDDHSSACWDGSKKAVKRRVQEDEDLGIVKRRRRFIFEKGNELIKCGHCDTKETSMSRMQEHITWDHPGLQFQAKQIPAWRFLCKSCAVKTMATSKMKYHLNRHISYRPYTCVTCGAFFPSPDQCRRHSRSQGHEEQYTYVRNPKKEAKVEELLEGTRQLALKVQEEAAKNPDFDISQTESFISLFQESKGNLKKTNPPGTSKNKKKGKSAAHNKGTGAEEQSKKQNGKSPQTVGIEQDITVKCYNCEFTSGSVSNISIHHKQAHPGKKFLWTEIERGFTCDSTGEALVDCDTVPGTSMDVGYTTRMTLGSGNNTMRFKCKTCDFSSYVIQAMKSHLKSHQPKGFICPYCSRAFSGNTCGFQTEDPWLALWYQHQDETHIANQDRSPPPCGDPAAWKVHDSARHILAKLMRHQYCLHKGQALWVIHLRRAGMPGSTSVKKVKGSASEESKTTVKEEVTPQEEDEEDPEMETDSEEKLPKKSPAETTYVCSECSFTSESLYDFRRHLAQHHTEFRHKIQEPSEDTLLKHTSAEPAEATEINTYNFQCGYCDYTASNRSSVENHQMLDHSSLDPKILEINIKDITKEPGGKDSPPLLLNLKPHVTVERISDSVLNQYGYQKSEDCGSPSEDEVSEEGDVTSVLPSYDEGIHQTRSLDNSPGNNSDADNDIDDGAGENMMTLDMIGNESKFVDGENEIEVNDPADNFDSNLNPVTDSDQLARELGLVEDETSCVLGSESDMMIMQFGGVVNDKDSILPDENSNNKIDTEEGIDEDVDVYSAKIQSISSGFRSKDSTLFAAQEDDEDNDEVVTFVDDIMLASPLPMISLGDGVSLSPVDMESNMDNTGDDPMDLGEVTDIRGVDNDSEMLLDL